MAASILLTGSLPTGVTSFGPITPTVGVTSIQVAVDRTNLALLTKQINWALELSTDAGATWIPWGGASCPAGQIMTGTGIGGALIPQVRTESSFTVTIPPADVNTRLRGSITTLEPLTTSVTVRTS